ncbi:MAG TPA: DUF3891 family protein [Lacipirellulaceae bacterium]|nr:DUF3891 family protein [Lacipirellulaceae bacterium]
MIRREIQLAEEERLWLLISQVDHAHLSGEFTSHLQESFSLEVIEAITHHDDGWAEWETAPDLNPEIGAPYSFIEMPLTESLVIWDGSIAAARKFGPLAGFMVAGHFYKLLSDSEHANQPAALAWLAAKRKARTVWLDEWTRANSANTVEKAKQAQSQLVIADLFSLWLCCDTPVAGEVAGSAHKSPLGARAETLEAQFHLSVIGSGRRHATPENMVEALAWVISVDPYPFAQEAVSVALQARAVPVATYTAWGEIKMASRPMELRWRLMPPVAPPAG